MPASESIDNQIKELNDWRGKLYSKLRKLVLSVDKDIVEEFKWSTGVYSKNGLICAISTFKDHVKLNFFKGVQLKDKHKLINAGFDSKQHRAIDFSEGDKIDESKLKDLVKEAIEYNK
jgi:hypothetical protein